jgi:hypothetical protein
LPQQDGRSHGWPAALVRAGPSALSLAGLVSVAVGGFSCRLLVGTWGGGPYASGYSAEQSDDGSCVPFSFTGRSRTGPEMAGLALAIISTAAGALWFLVMAYAAAQSARLQCIPDTVAVAAAVAFGIAAFSVGVAFLGLANETCRPDWYGCVPGGMVYLVLFGAFCWAGAGGLLCHVYRNMKKQKTEGEKDAAHERARSSSENGGRVDLAA